MMHSYFAFTVAVVSLFVAVGCVHRVPSSDSLHGSIESVVGDDMTLTTKEGSRVLKLKDTTRIQRDSTEVGRTALLPDTHVSAVTTELPNGDVVAEEIELEDRGGARPHTHSHHH